MTTGKTWKVFLGVATLAAWAATQGTALAHRDPPTCTTSTASVGIREFFSVTGDPNSVVTRPKIVGETVFYQAAIGPIGGAQCAISGGNLYICTPDQITAGFDVTIASVQANCHFAGAVGNNCVGCTTPDPTLPGLVSVTEFDAPAPGSLIPYVVSLDDENALCGEAQIRARAFLVGATVHSPTGNVSPANADVPACNQVQTCTIQVDKKVSCDSAQSFPTGSFHDVGFVTADDDNTTDFCASWNANNGMPAESIRVEYVVRNTGTANASNCSGTESNTAITSSPINIGDILSGSDSEPTDADNACSANLVAGEPDQFDVTCICGAPEDNTGVTASAFDRAKFECLNPGLNVVKQCEQANLGSPSNFTITVTNSGADPAADLENCTITDKWFPADPSTQCTVVPANATVAATTPASITTLNGGDMASATGSFTSPTPGTICNNASVTCEIVGSTDVNGDPKTITASDTADCPVVTTSTTTSSTTTSSTTTSSTTTSSTTTSSTTTSTTLPSECFTRTPGFWGTHPSVTAAVLGATGLNSCGVLITTTDSNTQGSATEDICSVGKDAKTLNFFPQQIQLERQCMAANLNVAATLEGGGDCAGAFPVGDPLIPEGISALLDRCCNGTNAVCRSSDTDNEISASDCIGLIDAFNNTELTFNAGLPQGSAQPGKCQRSKNNGFVNSRPRATD